MEDFSASALCLRRCKNNTVSARIFFLCHLCIFFSLSLFLYTFENIWEFFKFISNDILYYILKWSRKISDISWFKSGLHSGGEIFLDQEGKFYETLLTRVSFEISLRIVRQKKFEELRKDSKRSKKDFFIWFHSNHILRYKKGYFHRKINSIFNPNSENFTILFKLMSYGFKLSNSNYREIRKKEAACK